MGTIAARQHVADILTILNIASVDASVIEAAQKSSITDFEDAVQSFAALTSNLDVIVSRNGSDFVGSPIEVLSPADFLLRLAQSAPQP
ncbi:hypothetical protein HC891_03805 [Candidatus Gracilibacteria bacterium]|nr:hypothetical protein [Candidatus Gracilibacteria bacterium]